MHIKNKMSLISNFIIIKEKINEKTFFVLAILAIVSLSACDSSSNKDNQAESTVNSQAITHQEDRETKQTYATAAQTNKVNETEAQKEGTYKTGKYKVGVDIPAGEYFIEALSAEDNGYMYICNDSNGNKIVNYKGFYTFIFVKVEDGQYLELVRCVCTPVDKMTITFDSSNLQDGGYRVGIDIPAGEYRLVKKEGKEGSSYCAYEDTSSEQKVVASNYFEVNDYVTVSDGQYLVLEDCTGSLVK